jgi:hypothetical protein
MMRTVYALARFTDYYPPPVALLSKSFKVYSSALAVMARLLCSRSVAIYILRLRYYQHKYFSSSPETYELYLSYTPNNMHMIPAAFFNVVRLAPRFPNRPRFSGRINLAVAYKKLRNRSLRPAISGEEQIG